ncbi:MAG: hypothetical protein KDK48_01810 [Chlamydiia bacterium]|nr:hypothetical protein [Chlamydiia bacterium]
MVRPDTTRSSALNVLETLVSLSEEAKGKAHAVLITHVLPTSRAYIEAVSRIFPVQLVIAIPYSADPATLDALKKQGIKTYLPTSVDDAFISAPKLVEELLKNSTEPLIVQEVGGYLAGATRTLARYPHLLGIVEDTNNGHWRYAEAGTHPLPVLSMAQSPIKDIEDTVIGDSVIYSTERIFREEFHAVLQGMRTGVIGYGKIGTSTTIALKGREASVQVYDIDPAKMIRARYEGQRISPLHSLLQTSDLIVGCTGKTSVRGGDIPFIKEGAILVSASAKNEEFDLTAFEHHCRSEELSPVVRRYTRKDGSCFYLLNKGTPVNFRDRSILGPILDMIYSELFLCMRTLLQEKLLPGLQHSPPKVHTEVAKTWLKIYEESFAAAQDKVWDYPESLCHAVTHTFRLQTSATLSA